MSLALRADAVATLTLPFALDLDLGAFVWTIPDGPRRNRLYNADVAALRAQLRLLLRKETVIADQVEGFIEDRLVIAAVVFQRCKVLVDDLVVVGERIGWMKLRRLISARSSPSSRAGDVQQPLDDENAMLAPGRPGTA